MLYFVVYLLLVYFAVRSAVKPFRANEYHIVLQICMLIFIFVAGLRYEIGYDYFAYREYYEECVPINELFSSKDFFVNIWRGWEPGVVLLFSTLKVFFKDSQVVFFVSSVICSVLLFKSLKKFSEPENIFMSILIYFSFVYMYQEMHALRQALGASVFYYSLYQLSMGRHKNAFITTLCACCFHYSFLLFLPFVFFFKRKINLSVQLIALLISFIIFICRIRWIVPVIGVGASFFPALGVVDRVLAYTEMETIERPFFVTFICYLLPYIYILIKDYKYNIINSPQLKIAFNLYFIYLILTMIFWEFSAFSVRYGWICLFGMSVCLPYIVNLSIRNKKMYIAYVIVFCFLPIQTFLFPDITTSQFSPYEGYITHKVLGVKGSGRERVERYAHENGVVFRF